jgi:hypothetical protein
MGLIDQMKYAKLLYLADVLEDIQNEMRKNWHCRNFADNINGIVKDVRETIADTTPPNEMECEQIEIKRLEHMIKRNVLGVPHSEIENLKNHMQLWAEVELLDFIKNHKLIRVRKHEEDNGDVIFTASLIVGIEKQPYVPEEPKITFMDDLAKYLDETRQ